MRCPSCLTLNPVTNRFCGQCGTRLDAVHTGAPAPVAARGEVKIATVLFADVVSSTEHVAGLDAEQAMEQLRPAVQQMCAMVERYGGTVLRTLGDGIMALFGVPRALEGHARLACEAAQALQQVFTGNALGLAIRVGLHSGPVALDPADAAAQMGGGVHGVAIHIASRVVALAASGGVCLTHDCLALIGAGCHVRSMGAQQLKGLATPTEVLALAHLDTEADTHAFSRARLSRLRGREGELATLQRALQLAENGQAPVIGVVGAPGTGKSRLCQEFVATCRSRLVPVHEVRSQLYGHATPLQPVLELLRGALLGILPGDPSAVARQRIAERLRVGGATGPDDAAVLQEFLGVLADDAAPPALQPRARRARLLQIVRKLVATVSSGISVIVFEDLHWLDEASAEFVHAMVEAAVGTRTLLVLNYRPAYRAPWQALPSVQQIALAELTDDDATALVGELLSTRPDLQAAVPLIVQRCAGNPFFAEELVRSLLAHAASAADTGAAPARAEDMARSLPATVQTVIGARVDALGETEKTLLQICAVIGKEVLLPVLERVAITLGAPLGATLEALCTLELLQPQAAVTGQPAGFAFRHPLIQEVAYTTQLKSRRAAVHAATAEAMQAFYQDRGDEFAALVAHHFGEAGRNVDAAEFEARAGRWIHYRDSRQAVKHWFKVRDWLHGQARSPQVDRLRVTIGSYMTQLAWRESVPSHEVLPLIDAAIELAALTDARSVQLFHVGNARMRWAAGASADDYVQRLRQVLATVDTEDGGRKAVINVFLSQGLAWAGLFNEALKANDEARIFAPAIERADHEYIGFNVAHWLIGQRLRILTRMGRAEEIDELTSILEDVLASSPDPAFRMTVHYMLVEAGYLDQRPVLMMHHTAQLQALAQSHRNPYLVAYAHSATGLSELISPKALDAGKQFEAVVAVIRDRKVAPELESEVLALHAYSRLRGGDLDGAVRLAEEAVAVASQRSNRFALCLSLLVTGHALRAKGDAPSLQQAQQHLEKADALLTQTGAHVLRDFFVDFAAPGDGLRDATAGALTKAAPAA